MAATRQAIQMYHMITYGALIGQYLIIPRLVTSFPRVLYGKESIIRCTLAFSDEFIIFWIRNRIKIFDWIQKFFACWVFTLELKVNNIHSESSPWSFDYRRIPVLPVSVKSIFFNAYNSLNILYFLCSKLFNQLLNGNFY